MKILVTGGSGRLGTRLKKLIPYADFPTHEELDITRPVLYKPYDLIIHCAGYTDVAKAEIERDECFRVNVLGTHNLTTSYPYTPFVYISTEYVYNPVNYYSETKRLAEEIVREKCSNFLIIRTVFKPRPYPYDRAFIDQYTQGDYIDVIDKMILFEILKWDKCTPKTIDVGTGRKTIYELAKQTKSDVKEASVDDVKGVKLPKDYQ